MFVPMGGMTILFLSFIAPISAGSKSLFNSGVVLTWNTPYHISRKAAVSRMNFSPA